MPPLAHESKENGSLALLIYGLQETTTKNGFYNFQNFMSSKNHYR